MGNFSDLMKQAKAMQSQLHAAQQRIESLIVEGSAAEGKVSVVMTGRHLVKTVKVDDSLLHNKTSLENFLLSAFNDAVKKVDARSQEQMTSLAANLDLPPSAE